MIYIETVSSEIKSNLVLNTLYTCLKIIFSPWVKKEKVKKKERWPESNRVHRCKRHISSSGGDAVEHSLTDCRVGFVSSVAVYFIPNFYPAG